MLLVQSCYENGLLQQQLRSETTRPVSSESCWKKKSIAAAKNHAVAERKRRKRINSHISTLRSLLPNLSRGDKARVLTETVLYIKQLRRKAAEHWASQQHEDGCCCSGNSCTCLFILPGEKDEVQVNYIDGGEEKTLVKATICCEDRPKLNFDMANAVVSGNGKVIKAEMATVGGRTKATLVVQLCNESGGGCREDVLSLTRALKALTINRSSAWATHLSSKPMINQWSPESSTTQMISGADSGMPIGFS